MSSGPSAGGGSPRIRRRSASSSALMTSSTSGSSCAIMPAESDRSNSACGIRAPPLRGPSLVCTLDMSLFHPRWPYHEHTSP